MSEHLLFEIRQYNLLKNYFDDEKEIEFLLERYNNGERKDFILENLQTHDKNTSRAEDFLYKNCNGVCFHLCEKSMFKESILKTGLRCKNRDNDKASKYRNWPKRIYVYATESYKNKEKLKSELDDLAYEISDGYLRLEDYVVLRIQFPSTGLLGKFNFYKDTVMNDSGSYFVYQNIPGNFISIMNI